MKILTGTAQLLVFVLTVLIITLSIGLGGCDEAMNMMPPTDDDIPAEPIDYYQLVDEGLAGAIQKILISGRPAGIGIFDFIEEEFGFPYNQEIAIQLEQIIREEKDMGPGESIDSDMMLREYLKLRLEFPEKNLEEILDLYRGSVRNDALPFVRVNQPTPVDEDPEDGPPLELPVQEAEVPPEIPEQPVRPGEEPLPELEAWSQATNIALGTIRLMELRELEPQYKFGDSISEETEEVLVERTGLTWEQLKNLTDICLVESGDIVFVEKFKRFVAFTDVLAHYVQLTLIHPEKTESEILDLFTERCKRREVTAEASVVAEGYYSPQYLEDLQWEWEQTLNEDEEKEEGGEEEGDHTAPLPEG